MAAGHLEGPGQRGPSSDSDSSGRLSFAEFGVNLIAPPLRREQLSAAARHQIAFSQDGCSLDSADLVEVEARQTSPDKAASSQFQNISYVEEAKKNGFRSIGLLPLQNSPVQHYLSVEPDSSSAGCVEPDSSSAGSANSAGQEAVSSTSHGYSLQVYSLPASSARSDPQAPLPLNASEQLPSLGSALHAGKSCKPCLLLNARSGCHQGYFCNFCHSTHARKNIRPCKGKRDRFKKLLEFRALREQEESQKSPREAPHGGPIISL